MPLSHGKSRTLLATDLTSKWGFWDGDILRDGGILERPHPLPEGADNHAVLIWLVRKHLLPLLPGVEVYEIGTCHNPIRTDQELTPEQDDVQVEIAEADVLEAVRALEV